MSLPLAKSALIPLWWAHNYGGSFTVRLENEQASMRERDPRNEAKIWSQKWSRPAARGHRGLHGCEPRDLGSSLLRVVLEGSQRCDVGCGKKEAAEAENLAKPHSCQAIPATPPEPLQGNATRLELVVPLSPSATLNHRPFFSLISTFKVIARTLEEIFYLCSCWHENFLKEKGL